MGDSKPTPSRPASLGAALVALLLTTAAPAAAHAGLPGAVEALHVKLVMPLDAVGGPGRTTRTPIPFPY